MASTERRRSIGSRLGKEHSLAAPGHGRRATSKSPASSAVSMASSEDLPTASGGGADERLRSRTNSEDARSDTSAPHPTRMAKLFKTRKRNKPPRGHDELPPPPVRPSGETRDYSDDSLGLAKSVTSSLLTEESDVDAPPPKRPGISPHHSHAGLLTLSSPLIASETLESLDSLETATNATLTDTILAPAAPSPATKRAVSPVGKLKHALVPARRSTSPQKTRADPHADEDPPRPSTSGGGAVGSLFGGKKRQDKILNDPLQASPPQLRTGDETQSSTPPKRLITQISTAPPNLLDAPVTFITPPTPTDGNPASPTDSTSSQSGTKPTATQSDPDIIVSPSGNMISHRRIRSVTNSPSKLSHHIAHPLTPHPEESKTPGGTAVVPQSPSGSGSFFASIFSAAQNAASNITDTITSNPGSKQKATQHAKKEQDTPSTQGGEEVIGPDTAASDTAGGTVKRRPAIETLGSGNLSLAHLGIEDSNEVSPMSSAVNFTMKSDEAAAQVEDMAASQAVSAAYAGEKAPSVASERPRSLTAVSALAGAGAGAASPPRQPDPTSSPAASSMQRQSSIRSRISAGRRRRHRGSSAATGTPQIGGPGASTSTLAPSAALSSNRLNGTGFAVASPKRNRDFHALFKSVPEDDYLIEDYSAALQREILLHGRLYVSEGHLCFSSNILGWVTNLVISFDEVVSVEKKSTAVVFPNAIVIQTLQARNVFASFLSRDSTYDLIIGIWRISHPNLKSSLNGVVVDGGTGDKTEKAESVGSEDASLQDSEDEIYDEDADDDDGMGSFTEAGEGSVAGSEISAAVPAETRKVSGTIAQAMGGAGELTDAAKAATHGVVSSQDFPGAASHAPTECGDNDLHYDKLLIDTTIPAPLGKVYSLMFGPASGTFMRKWLIEDQKSLDLQMEDDKKGLGEDKKSFSYSYIKPLNAPVGPRQTKCNIAMTLEQFDLDKAVIVQCSTGTPDVPSGGIFLTKTRYCLMWGPGNSTRLIMTFTVEWSGKSWLRGPIEKGANDGQMSYATSITAALRTAVSSSRPTGLRAPGGKPGKGRKRSKTQLLDETTTAPAPTASAQAKKSDWGLFEPLRSLLGPVADMLEALFIAKILIMVLSSLLLYTWLFRGPTTALHGPNAWTSAQRQVAYEELWRHEESELWDWLEERVALDRVRRNEGVAKGAKASEPTEDGGNTKPQMLSMRDRDVDEAIRVTEERLRVLKGAVLRRRQEEEEKAKNRGTRVKGKR